MTTTADGATTSLARFQDLGRSMPRSLSSKRNWTAEGSPAASGQVSGQGRGQAAPRLTSDDSIRTYVPFWPETCVSTPHIRHICHILYLRGGLKPAFVPAVSC